MGLMAPFDMVQMDPLTAPIGPGDDPSRLLRVLRVDVLQWSFVEPQLLDPNIDLAMVMLLPRLPP